MAKKSSLREKLAALPKARHGVTIFEGMTPDQRAEFEDGIAWFRDQLPQGRPTMAEFVATIEREIGVKVSAHTIRRLINGEYSRKT